MITIGRAAKRGELGIVSKCEVWRVDFVLVGLYEVEVGNNRRHEEGNGTGERNGVDEE